LVESVLGLDFGCERTKMPLGGLRMEIIYYKKEMENHQQIK
jgi:hypothetical protein